MWLKTDYEFFRYDFNMTVEELNSIICRIENCGYHVISITTDMFSANVSLAKQMGVSEEQPWFKNPIRPDSKIYWIFDQVHLLKLIRTHLVNSGFKLASGTLINRAMFQKLLKAKGNSEITIGFKLTEKHLFIKDQDKQRVRPAAELLSRTTSNLLKILFPEDTKMQELSDFVLKVDSWFDVLNSFTIHHTHKKLKEAFEQNYEVSFHIFKKDSSSYRKSSRYFQYR